MKRLIVAFFLLLLFALPLGAITKLPVSVMKRRERLPVIHSAKDEPYYPAVSIEARSGTGFFREHQVYEFLPEMVWPHMMLDRHGRVHIVTTLNVEAGELQLIGYFFSEDGLSYSDILVVDTTLAVSPTVATSPVSDKVAIVYTRPRDMLSVYNSDVWYIESPDGTSWDLSDRVNLTEYTSADTLRAYCDLDAIYDNEDRLHIVFNAIYFDETTGITSGSGANIYHWSEETGFSLVANGWFDTYPGVWNRTVSKMNIGEDPETGYLYCTWTQFSSTDVASSGYSNGDIYASVSTDNGASWGEPHNLTRTSTPFAAPGDCRSEHWSSLAKLVNDTLHIIYIEDKDAGGIPQGEGSWTNNPVRYLQVPASALLEPPDTTPNTESPGEIVGWSWYDYQQNSTMGKLIAVDTEGGVHLSWMKGFDAGAVVRHIFYNHRTPDGVWLFGDEGVRVENLHRSGYCTIDVSNDLIPFVAYHTDMIYEDASGPLAVPILPPDGAISACREQGAMMRIVDTSGVEPSTIVFSVGGELFTPADSELSFEYPNLTFSPAVPFEDNDTITLTLLSVDDSLGNSLATPVSWRFFTDFSPPVITGTFPPDGAVISCPDSAITVWFADAVSSVDTASVHMFVNREEFFPLDPEMTVAESSATISYLTFASGTVVTVEIDSLLDTPDLCLPNALVHSSFSYIVDTEPPYVVSVEPADGSTISERTPTIRIIVADDVSGVNLDSAYVVINSDTLAVSAACVEVSGDTIIIPTDDCGLHFSPGDEVTCEFSGAEDRVTVCDVNRMEPYSWQFRLLNLSCYLPDTTATPGDTIYIPVYTRNAGGMDAYFVHIAVNVNPDFLTPLGVETEGTFLGSWTIDGITTLLDYMVVELSGAASVETDGVLAYLVFVVPDDAPEGEETEVILDEVVVNSDFVPTENGRLLINWRSALWLYELSFMDTGRDITSRVSFGMSNEATENYDLGIDILSLPPVPGELGGYFSIHDPAHPHITGLSRDIRNSHSIPSVWELITCEGGGTVLWEIEYLPAGRLTLNDSLDMTVTTEYSFSANETLYIRFDRPPLEFATITLYEGWNLVSLPVVPMAELAEIFPTMIGDAYRFLPDEGRYEPVLSPQPGEGFWILSSSATSVTLSGMRLEGYHRHLSRGWNILGALSSPYPADSLCISEGAEHSPLYRFIAPERRYEMADTLLPGDGYWIYLFEPITVSVGD